MEQKVVQLGIVIRRNGEIPFDPDVSAIHRQAIIEHCVAGGWPVLQEHGTGSFYIIGWGDAPKYEERPADDPA